MALFTDTTQAAIDRALDGVAFRQRMAAQNVANIMTPGYRAQKVQFEDALTSAVARGGNPLQAELSVVDGGGAAREDGNTVSLEAEQQTLMTSGLQYQALVDATNFKLNVIRAAIGH